MTARPRVVLTRVLVVLYCLVIAGCGPSDQVADPEKRLAFQQLVEREIAEASAHGASEQQIAILEDARDNGVLVPEAMRKAIDAYAECVESAGLDFEFGESTGPSSFPRFDYYTTTTLGGDVAVMDACHVQQLSFVNTLYHGQPEFRGARDELLESRRGEVVACLRDEGLDLPEDATVDEMRRELTHGFTGQYPGEPPSEASGPFFDCLSPIGLTISDMGY